jgi:predicted restriction endonuclease
MAALKLTKEDKIWAFKIKDRDCFKCAVCGVEDRSTYLNKKGFSVTTYLNSHHLLPRERKDTKFELMNGISLCVKHHMFCRINSAHNNPLAFSIWLQANRPEQFLWCREKINDL